MDVRVTIQNTIDYIEEHLNTELTLEDLARGASYSAYHFHRLFQVAAGVPVMTYIKNRRLDRAAQELLQSDRKIVDIALDSGFGTHETFTRAFKRYFHRTPGAYRRAGHHTHFYPRLHILDSTIATIGGIQMKPSIIQKPEMKVLGYIVRTSSNDDRGMQEIPAFWERYLKEGLRNNIPNKLHPNIELGVCVDFDPESGDYGYLIGFEVAEEQELTNTELAYRTVPASTYAVFTTQPAPREQFTEMIQGTWEEIFRNWFPASGYEHAGTSDLEWYDDKSNDPAHMQMDIYIPIKKKAVTTG